MNATRKCSVETCDRSTLCKGFCAKHYQRNAKYGTPTPYKPSERERFWSKVAKGAPDECWIWQAARRGDYGFFNLPPTTMGAHKYAYIEAHGPVPAGFQVDHMCHVKLCCNPAHLQVVTPKQNTENHSGPARNNSSGIRGVYFTQDKSWRGQVGHAGRSYSAGSHATREAAAAAVLNLRLELHTNNLKDRANA